MSLQFARAARRAGLLGVLFAVLSACGGGGGGGGNSITVSPGSLSFVSSQGHPAEPQAVSVSFSGAGLVIGYAPGVPVANWLGVTDGIGNQILISVDPNMPPGTYATTLRFVTGDADGSNLAYDDVSINYRVSDLSVSPAGINPVVVQGSTAQPFNPEDQYFQIGGSAQNWTIESSASWLVLEQASGSGPGTVAFHFETAELALGTHPAFVTVHDTTNGDSVSVPVTLLVRSSILRNDPQTVAFAIDRASLPAALTQTLQLMDERDGADESLGISWTLDAPQAPWLSASALSGTTAPAASLQLTLVPEQLSLLANGTHSTTLTFHYARADEGPAQIQVPVTLNLDLPRARSVMPRAAVAGSDLELTLHGQGLEGLAPADVLVDGTPVAALTVLNDRQARIVLPAGLAAGTHDVVIDNALDFDFNGATVAVVEARDRPYAAFAVAGVPARVLFDDARETLWVATMSDTLEPYTFDGANWSAGTPISVANLRDIALDLDGDLLITTRDALYGLDLDDAAAVPVLRFQKPSTLAYFYNAGLAGDGTLLLPTDSPSSSGFFEHYFYNVDTNQLAMATPYPNSDFRAHANASADGALVYLDGYYDLHRYTAGVGLQALNNDNVTVRSVDRHGTRVSNQGYVYDQAFTLQGRMAAASVFSVFGPGGTRGYGFRADQSNASLGQNVIVANLSGTPVSGVYPESARVALADDPVVGVGWQTSFLLEASASPLALSADERTLFIRGYEKLVIVPLPAP
jgi:hypothetical protein